MALRGRNSTLNFVALECEKILNFSFMEGMKYLSSHKNKLKAPLNRASSSRGDKKLSTNATNTPKIKQNTVRERHSEWLCTTSETVKPVTSQDQYKHDGPNAHRLTETPRNVQFRHASA